MKKLRVIGFIGNFVPSFSTENDRKWSLEKLGYTVVPLQENKVQPWQLEDIVRQRNVDLLLYSHTHGWEIPGLKKIFQMAKDRNLPTASVHLDRWAGLERESDIGKEATWFTQYQFMADFSPEAQALYEKHKLNARHLKAGVVERECFLGPVDKAMFPAEIVFVGSKGYHKEYPFRAELIDFLQKTYGDRFAHWGSDGLGVLRGTALNTLFASSKIVVGDSCFGGRPNYVSDRYYETRGRGGFLLHPVSEGLEGHGVAHYIKEDTRSLKEKIDYYLETEKEREEMRLEGFEWVKEYETYTNRAADMMEVISE